MSSARLYKNILSMPVVEPISISVSPAMLVMYQTESYLWCYLYSDWSRFRIAGLRWQWPMLLHSAAQCCYRSQGNKRVTLRLDFVTVHCVEHFDSCCIFLVSWRPPPVFLPVPCCFVFYPAFSVKPTENVIDVRMIMKNAVAKVYTYSGWWWWH